ncbi:MAG TPA: penicillin-binding protein 1B [Burkholderiales bacterium]|nr:penicillin-binding protein 1B [Burkholderiales bacterium]
MFRRRIFGQFEPPGSKHWRYFRYAVLALALFAVSFTAYLDFRVRSEFEGRRFALPARIYARPLELHTGLRISEADVIEELREANYREGRVDGDSGWYAREGDRLEIAVRPFRFWDGPQNALRVRVDFDANAVAKVQDGQGVDLPLARLEPLPIGGIYPANNQDRVLVRLSEVPKPLVSALISTEDRNFYHHHGFDLRGIARAAWSFVRGHGLQGGSTLTQQLVKNFFLTPERTLRRKGTEFIMAVLLELHYGKDEILETYLNEIYLGQDRDRAIHGVGLASLYYFGKTVDRLTLPEGALLVALVKGPGVYDPYRHPDRALERRNLVLREMRNTDAITPEEYMLARSTSLGVNPKAARGTSTHPAFVDLVYRHLRRDYDEADLRSEGLRIFTTLDPRVQNRAEAVLERRLAQYDRDKRFGDPGIEGAVVITDSQTGEVEALVGGRDPRFRGFNRALDAARPVGSLLKPAIYLTALADPAHYTLITPLDDGPFVWKSRGAPDWEPMNFDRQFHGAVPLRTAIAQSLNVATARLGTDIGISRVLGTIQRLGVEREMQPYASTLLGAVDLSPLEVAQLYQTIASGGFRAPLRAIREVTTAEGKPLKRYPLAVEQAFPPEPIYLITAAMQGVVREGTGQSLKNWVPPEIAVAGKTGTTDEQRDAWFAGFTGDRLAIVWVGYDDNRAARLTGAAAALPVWGEIVGSLSPEPLVLPKPDGIETVRIDPATGLRADAGCEGSLELPFANGSAPVERAPCSTAVGIAVDSVKQTTKNWWQRLWGR